MDNQDTEIELFIAGLVLDPDSNTPIVILKDETGDRCLPIWIGVNEATAIASALKKVPLARPLTHDLLHQIVDTLGGKVAKVSITRLEENTFFANVEIINGEVVHQIDARPSDALALAVKVSAPIFVLDSVLTKAEVKIVAVDEIGDIDDEMLSANVDDTSRDFNSIDKDKWAELLEDMDPTDFKYKM